MANDSRVPQLMQQVERAERLEAAFITIGVLTDRLNDMEPKLNTAASDVSQLMRDKHDPS